MKRFCLMLVLTALVAAPLFADRLNVVEITDMFGEREYEIMTQEEYMKVYTQVQEEKAIFSLMLNEVRKEWNADKKNSSSFPGSKVHPRSVRKMPPEFRDEEKAQKRKQSLERRFADRKVREREDNSRKLRRMRGNRREKYLAEEREDKENSLRAVSLVLGKMSAKLGREVPKIGLGGLGAAQAQAKKAAPKKAKKAKQKAKK